MAKPQWPSAEKRRLIGKRIDRLDGPIKSTGVAKYAYDQHFDGLLYAKIFYSPYPSATINAVNMEAAKALPGVETVWVDESLIGKEVRYVGQVVAAVAAVSEEIANEALRLITLDATPQEAQIDDTDPSKAEEKKSEREEGDFEATMAAAEVKSTGRYSIPVITHCCLESHGQTAKMEGDHLYIWPSTQAVSLYANGLDEAVGVPQANIHVDCQVMGGGFGSKFSHDKWGVIGSLLAKETGKPVKLMLERDQELMVAGNRPSAHGEVTVGVNKSGKLQAMEATLWGTGGSGGYRPPPVPYVFTKIPATRLTGMRIKTNRGGQRAWRGPGHPQGCFLTMAAVEDAAAAIGMDALEFFKTNLELTERAELYAKQLDIAADLIGYKTKAHLRGDKTDGPLKRGIGIGIHTWGGLGHPSNCDISVHPDGSVVLKMGTQDLGVGTRTVVGIVAAETFGLPLEAIDVNIGSNAYPSSNASGGSTTVGGISAATRLASTDALNKLIDVVAPRLDVDVDDLEAVDGKLQSISDPTKSIPWKDACKLLGAKSVLGRGENIRGESQEMGLIDQGVGGVQMADVTVDIETGVVTLNEMAAVQDCGLIIDLKTAESQVYGGLIMGITYALYEECIYDNRSGRMLNADMEFYRLAGLKDVGQLKVHMMTGPGFDERGVIGLGEPPVISPGAAISNAVANACGVRVPELPLTPDKVVAALQAGGIV